MVWISRCRYSRSVFTRTRRRTLGHNTANQLNMQTTVKRLRHLVHENLDVEQLDEYDGFTPGDWYTDGKGDAHELLHIFVRDFGGKYGKVVMARTSTSDGTSQQRFDVWQKGQRLATPEEVEETKARWNNDRRRAARYIDTRREGT